MKEHVIIEFLRQQKELKLIFAKNDLLMEVFESLIGSTTDVSDYVYVFDLIESKYDLKDEGQTAISKLVYDLTSNEDMRVTLSDEIDSLCSNINNLNSHIEKTDLIHEHSIDNQFHEYEELRINNILELLRTWVDTIQNLEKDIFQEAIHKVKRIEEAKSIIIKELEGKLHPIKKLASELGKIDEIANEWYSQLNEIETNYAYTNDFNYAYLDKILKHYASGLNSDEKKELVTFFEYIKEELNIN